MKATLVDLLVCPRCSGPLRCAAERLDPARAWEEVLEGHLLCDACDARYPIRRGVPRLIEGPRAREVENTVTGFGFEWEKFEDRIEDTYMTDRANFLDFIFPVLPEFFRGKIVLDAGCGMGRFLKLGAEFGSREIVGVDLSDSVDVSYRRVAHLPNAHVVQADIMALPFGRSFDYAFSVGVLQFLEDPRAGFEALVRHLKEDGTISVWVYAEENNRWVINFVSPLRRHVTSRLPRPVLYGLSHAIGLPLYAVIQGVYRPANRWKARLDVSRVLPYFDYLSYSSRLTYSALVSVIFDHLVPSLVTYLSREELTSWFPESRFSDVHITSRNNMSWRATGTTAGPAPGTTTTGRAAETTEHPEVGPTEGTAIG
jgi:SAM-dependent methyltransferase